VSTAVDRAGELTTFVAGPMQHGPVDHVWRFARRQPVGFAAALVILITVLVAIFAPIVAPYDPLQVHRGRSLEAPSREFWLGTDDLGRDVFSRIVYGARVSLQVGLIAVTAGTLVGALVGLTTGYWGGLYDLLLQRVIDALQAFPGLVLALAIASALGPSLRNSMIAVAILLIPGAARLTRGATLSAKEQQFVEATRAMGAADLRILALHIVPNIFAPVLVLASIVVGAAILIEASLGFLGLGVPPPAASWGSMLSGAGRQFFIQAPWLAIAPGVAIGLVVLSFNLFGDALRDAIDPKLRGSR
jgi:peptide/nickel transport system permease protein